MKREKIVFIIGLISILIGSIVSVSAVTYLYNANEVSYDNSTSHLNSTDVQGAINELYDAAQDYSSINTRVTGLESYFKGTVTSNFNSNSIHVGQDTTGTTQSFVNMYLGGDSRGGIYTSGTQGLVISGKNGTSGSWGSGQLSLRGNPVQINGYDPITSKNTYAVNNVVTNCNAATAPGTNYYVKGNGANCPNDTWLIVWSHAVSVSDVTDPKLVVQFATQINVSSPKLWMRATKNTGVWSSWVAIV